jgi:methionine aminotransferase
MESQPDFGTRLGSFFQAKRDAFFAALAPSRFHLLPCRGTYFALADYRDIQPDMPDQEFARWLTLTHGVATIPVSAFYADGTDNRLVRFCFAKTEDTLEEAAQRLCRV